MRKGKMPELSNPSHDSKGKKKITTRVVNIFARKGEMERKHHDHVLEGKSTPSRRRCWYGKGK